MPIDDPVLKKRLFSRQYHPNGDLKSEGWLCMSQKEGYWKYYYPSGTLSSKGHYNKNQRSGYWYFFNPDGSLIKEGHFKHDHAENWWIFYEIGRQEKSKIQFKNNKKNGFSLRYNKNRLIRVEKYIDDIKTGEWTSLYQFKIDNPNVSF